MNNNNLNIEKQVLSKASKKISGHCIENNEIIFCDKFGNILREKKNIYIL